MKKILLTAAIVSGFALSGLSQGLIFQSTKAAGVYFTPQSGGYALGNNTLNVAFLWGSAGAASAVGVGLDAHYSGAALDPNVWTTILNDPNFQVAKNGANEVVVPVNNSGITQAGWNYNGGAPFIPVGMVAGNTYSVFAVAFSSTYSTLEEAAAAGSLVGWGSVIQYSTSASAQTAPPTFNGAGQTAFGVATLAPVPEPTTMALAALGGASLLLFRRRK